MITQVQSKSAQGTQPKPPPADSDETVQYWDFDRVIEKNFGIINDVGILFSQSSDQMSLDAEESDPLPKAKSAPDNFQRLLPAAAKKKIRKAHEESQLHAGTSKDLVILKNRDIDINKQVRNLRKCYNNGSYAWHPELQKRILNKKLVLREFASICKEINPIK